MSSEAFPVFTRFMIKHYLKNNVPVCFDVALEFTQTAEVFSDIKISCSPALLIDLTALTTTVIKNLNLIFEFIVFCIFICGSRWQ